MFTIQVQSLKINGREFPLSKMVLLKIKIRASRLCLPSFLTDFSRLIGGSVWRAGFGSHKSGKTGIMQSLRHKKGLLSHKFYSIVTPQSCAWKESKAIKQFTVSSVLLHTLESRHV